MKPKMNLRRWVPLVESLESRAVLSVCGVTCELTEGMLHVQGTTADDLIAVRYDAESASVSVLGRNEELLGQYAAADVRGLNINGLGGNDSLHVDPALDTALAANGAEGEASVSGNMHSHGAVIPTSNSTKSTSSTFTNFGPSIGPSLTQTLNSISVSNTSASTGGSTNLAVTNTSIAEHVSHGATASPDISLTSHVHDSPLAGAMMVTVASAVTMPNHGHVSFYRPLTPGSSEATSGRHNTSVVEAVTGEWDLAGHDDNHDLSVTTNVAFSKLVAKPCTVSYSSGLVVTSLDGKRQCNCEQKAQAAEEIKQALNTRKEVGDDGSAAVECIPCQNGLLLGLLGEAGTCSPGLSGDAMLLAMLEDRHNGACLSRSEAEDAAVTEASWLDSLQYVGWPLVAASVALVPALFERREKKIDEEESEPRLDWLFGRLQVEPLLARS